MIFPATVVFITASLATLAKAEPKSWGQNVCNETVPFQKNIKIEKPIEYTIKYWTVCGVLPCEKVRRETRFDSSIATIVALQAKSVCCPGFAETPLQTCEPVCWSSCGRGKCVGPNKCKCQPEPTKTTPGFIGSTCDRFTCLDETKWGLNCDKQCNCATPNSYCNASTGKCVCYPGWGGKNCTTECDNEICDKNTELLPIIEPDANVVEERGSTHMKLAALEPESLKFEEIINNNPSSKGDMVYSATNVIIMSMSVIIIVLLIALLKFKQTLTQMTSHYGSASDVTGRSSNNNYSDQSTYYAGSRYEPSSEQTNNYLSKNLSFDLTTRNLIGDKTNGGSSTEKDEFRSKAIWNSDIESRLISSMKTAEENDYSEITPNSFVSAHRQHPSDNSFSDNLYKDPRPLVGSSTNLIDQTSRLGVPNCPGSSNDGYDDNCENIYEEIKTKRSP